MHSAVCGPLSKDQPYPAIRLPRIPHRAFPLEALVLQRWACPCPRASSVLPVPPEWVSAPEEWRQDHLLLQGGGACPCQGASSVPPVPPEWVSVPEEWRKDHLLLQGGVAFQPYESRARCLGQSRRPRILRLPAIPYRRHGFW